jgi:hypothetical protein
MPETRVERPRVDFTLAADVLAWVAQRTGAGDPFTGESQAAELALARLRAEESFIREQCKREGVAFDAAAFWRLYAAEIEASTPTPKGRRPRGAGPPERQVKRMIAGLDAELLRWVDSVCEPKGPFETASHATETALRHLQALESPERVPLDSFRFQAAEWWRRYKRGA